MNRSIIGALVALSLCVSSPAMAGPKFILQPVPVGGETVRFQQGVPTLDRVSDDGAVQVTPLPMDHGSLAFGIVVYNSGKTPANIDITNFEISAGGPRLAVFSREQLEKKAANRAMWQQIALAAAGGLAAAAAASARDNYHSTYVTPRGTYHYTYSAPSAAGQVAAAASIAGAGVGIAAIQQRLDATRAALGDQTVQLTTVDPGDSYAGRIVIEKIKAATLPTTVSFVVNWNGRAYPFSFQMVKPGTPQPAFPITAVPPIAAEPAPASVSMPLAPATSVLTPVVAKSPAA